MTIIRSTAPEERERDPESALMRASDDALLLTKAPLL